MAGFTVSSIEILVLFSFQVFFGYVYIATGIFFAIFMIGLSTGSFFYRKHIFKREINNFLFYQSGIAFMALVYLFFVFLFKNWYNQALIYLFSGGIIFSIGFLMGKLFSSATRLLKFDITEISSRTYGFDLIGSAFGALLIPTVLLPLLGFFKVAVILGFINILSVVFIWLRKSSGN